VLTVVEGRNMYPVVVIQCTVVQSVNQFYLVTEKNKNTRNYTVSHKRRATLFWTVTPMFLAGFLHFLLDFYTSCTHGNRNEYYMEELQNLQLYLNYVSTLQPDKTKPHKTAHFEVIVTVFYYSTARMSL